MPEQHPATAGDEMSLPPGEIRYPILLRRIQALLIDSLVLWGAFILTGLIVSRIEMHGGLRAAIVIFALLAIEPGLVSTTGATIGHRLIGLKVQDKITNRNLGIFRATFRFFLKYFLGMLSLIFVLSTRRHQALHDLAAGSVVVVRDPSSTHELAMLSERVIENNNYVYPSKVRRVVLILSYSVAVSYLYGVLMELSMSEDCFNRAECSSAERMIDMLMFYGFTACLAATVVLGWRGFLWGCRRKERTR